MFDGERGERTPQLTKTASTPVAAIFSIAPTTLSSVILATTASDVSLKMATSSTGM